MKDLIKEIEIERNYRGNDNEFEKGFHYGVDMCLKKINNHNLITAPKSIKLSEIVDKIYGTKFKSECWVEPIRTSKNCCRIRIQYGDGYWGDYDFYIENKKIVIYADECLLPFNEFKWLYILWIAGTTIIDDLEG